MVIATLVGVLTGGGKLKPARAKRVRYLYSQTARGAALVGASGREGKLVMTGVSPVTTRFSDRPAREADSLSTASFIAAWEYRFRKDSPNAALVFGGRTPQDDDTAVLELSGPSYDAQAGTLVYRVVDIESSGPGGSGWKDTPLESLPVQTGPCSLFIDGAEDANGLAENPKVYEFAGTDLRAVCNFYHSGRVEVTFMEGGTNLGTVTHTDRDSVTDFEGGGLQITLMHTVARAMRPGFEGTLFQLRLAGMPFYRGQPLEVDTVLAEWPY